MIFDVFGTLVDWRSCVAREARAAATSVGVAVDGDAFADAWRAGYQPAMEAVRSGARPWVDLDVLHREILDAIVDGFGLGGMSGDARADLTRAWHRLDAWPDVVAGIERLRERYLVAPCSNGHIALMVALARRNGLRWDAIAGAELVHEYKPKPILYLSAARALGCEPAQVLMVASHSWDLGAAAASGLRTAHVARPDEKGPGLGESAPTVAVDLAVASIGELADRLP